MAQYVTEQKAFLDIHPGGPRLVKPGTTVDYRGWPGSALTPLDDEAQEIKEHYDEMRAAKRLDELPKTPDEWLKRASGHVSGRDEVATLKAQVAELQRKLAQASTPIAIPADWSDLSKPQRIALAKKLGAPFGINTKAADEWIKAEIDRRAQAAKAPAPAPAPKPAPEPEPAEETE